MKRHYMAAKVDSSVLLEAADAVREMEAHGSRITSFSSFGIDPLMSRGDLVQQREDEFRARYNDFAQFFSCVVNGNFRLFRDGLLFFIEKSKHLQSQL